MFKTIKQFIKDVNSLATDAKIIKRQLAEINSQITEVDETINNVAQALPTELEAKLKLTMESVLEPLHTKLNAIMMILPKGIR